MADPVLIHAGNARAAARRHNVRAEDILAILSVEGGTDAWGRPVAPGDGLGPPSYGQFIRSTGAKLGVKYGDSASETDAVARYLNQLGYQSNRARAIGAYNGGPANPQMGYAQKVLAAAKRYVGAGPDAPAPASAPAKSDGDGLFGKDERSGATKALLWVATVAAGMVIAGVGVSRMLGVRNPLSQVAA